MAGKSQAPQGGSCQYRSINEHLEIHADTMRTPGVGVSGSLHLAAGGRDQGSISRYAHYTGPTARWLPV